MTMKGLGGGELGARALCLGSRTPLAMSVAVTSGIRRNTITPLPDEFAPLKFRVVEPPGEGPPLLMPVTVPCGPMRRSELGQPWARLVRHDRTSRWLHRRLTASARAARFLIRRRRPDETVQCLVASLPTPCLRRPGPSTPSGSRLRRLTGRPDSGLGQLGRPGRPLGHVR